MSTRPRRRLIPLLALAVSGLVGCAGLSRPSDLRPASHPLLEGVAPRTRLLPLAHRAAPSRRRSQPAPVEPAEPRREAAPSTPADESPPPGPTPPASESPTGAEPARAAIVQRLAELEGRARIDDRPATDMALLKAALADIPGVRVPGASLASARRNSRRVKRPAPGDLAFFHGAGGAAELAVVRGLRADGAIEAVAVTRGAVRPIVVHPEHPHARRRSGRLVNTFLRARRRGDEASAVYLAGQLLIDFRTLID